MKGLDLSDFFTTSAQAIDFTDRLANIEADLYEIGFELEKALQKNLGINKKDKFITLLRENEVAIDSKQSLSSFFEKVKEDVSNLPKATLTLAFEPDNELLNSISSWLVLNLNKQILIETVLDEEIIAGAIVDYQGRSHDTSVRKVFDESNFSSNNSDHPQKESENMSNPQKGN